MQPVSDFLEQFEFCQNKQASEQLLSLNMPDDITGWGIYLQDDFNSTDVLLNRHQQINDRIESRHFEMESLDVFGNGHAIALICRCKSNITLKNGRHIADDNLRLTFYLVEHEGTLKIRHGHLSRAWPAKQAFPSSPVQTRPPVPEEQSARLKETEAGPFLEHLQKRSAYVKSGNLEGILGLQHRANTNLYWQLQGLELRGIEQYRQHMLYLKEQFHEPTMKYINPVVFRNNSLACVSTFVEACHLTNGSRQLLSPLRVTYILQESEGQWLCRHSHWSIPFFDETADETADRIS